MDSLSDLVKKPLVFPNLSLLVFDEDDDHSKLPLRGKKDIKFEGFSLFNSV